MVVLYWLIPIFQFYKQGCCKRWNMIVCCRNKKAFEFFSEGFVKILLFIFLPHLHLVVLFLPQVTVHFLPTQ
jgi:hypothetical protein